MYFGKICLYACADDDDASCSKHMQMFLYVFTHTHTHTHTLCASQCRAFAVKLAEAKVIAEVDVAEDMPHAFQLFAW